MLAFMDVIAALELREPWWLLSASLAIPIALLMRRRGRLAFSSLALLPGQAGTWRTRLAWAPQALVALAIVAWAVALAGPRTPDPSSRVEREGLAIMLVVDRSSSMMALDLDEARERSRLDVVKQALRAFVRGDGQRLAGRADDAIGLVSFAGFAVSRVPLTFDHGLLLELLEAVEFAEGDDDGTAIGEGLELAVERLVASEATSRVAVLLTDGEQTAGVTSPGSAAAYARQHGVKVYTIGAGSTGTAPVPVTDPRTGQRVLIEQRVSIDEQTLRQVAEETGGRYFRATDAEGLRRVYAEIDRLEKSTIGEARDARYVEHFGVFIALGMALAGAGYLLGGTVLRRLP